jgi:ethanolamine ammonia-lyase small subunit
MMSQFVPSRRLNLRDYTPARVSLPAAGNSIATAEVLSFQLAHAQARDAVHAALDVAAFARRIEGELPILAEANVPVLQLRSNASSRAIYLRQPRLGRTLHPESAAQLHASPCDLSITVADGLSALAVERNAIPLLGQLIPQLLAAGWTLSPIAVVQQGRVAIGDPIGLGMGACMSLVLIGERPGLSSPDSLGAYLTWKPHPSRTDADRNCLSNIRTGGLSAESAAERLFWYLQAACRQQMTGTLLKEGVIELEDKGTLGLG